MLAAEKLLLRGVEDGVFPYAEWAVFGPDGIVRTGTTEGGEDAGSTLRLLPRLSRQLRCSAW